jgi:hypothetical protein
MIAFSAVAANASARRALNASIFGMKD